MTPVGLAAGFWQSRRVFLTGHTGFKGAWLHAWLLQMGAVVKGYSLPQADARGFSRALTCASPCDDTLDDVRDARRLATSVLDFQPDCVFHLAAQPLVRASYTDPLTTYATNVMGTAHLLEAVRHCQSVSSVVIVTTDKCYTNREWCWPYRESDPLGGHDPYSSSKACAELVTDCYIKSFFSGPTCSVKLATARAGNVIGPGDWSHDRLIPDAIRGFESGKELLLRHPSAIRPWQHVIEPLAGYLMLSHALHVQERPLPAAFNFGPSSGDPTSVGEVAAAAARLWGPNATVRHDTNDAALHEAHALQLDSSLARSELDWASVWTPQQAIALTVDGYKAQIAGQCVKELMADQIGKYMRYVAGKR